MYFDDMALEIAIILALILLNGFFSLSEMAIVSSRKARLRHEAGKGQKGYQLALETAENPSRFLSTIQVVISLVGTFAGAYGGATVAQTLAVSLRKLPEIAPYAGTVSVAIVVIATTFVSVVLGELVPKNLALARPERIAASVIRPLRILAVIFAPLTRLLSGATDLVIAMLGAKGASEPEVTEDEIRVLIAQGTETGIFEAKEREMVEGVLSLGDRRLKSLMTPRTDLVYVDMKAGLEAARAMILENARYGYLPAVDENLDRVIGMLPVKECLAAIATGSFDDPWRFIRRPVLVPESISALKAFSALKGGEVKAAIILDEYGGVAGLISLSDLMESIVGHMPLTGNEEEPVIIRREDGSYLVDGSLPVGRFVEELGLDFDLEEADYDTVAGLVLDRMGSIPHAGETCSWGDCQLEIVDMDGNRIDKILVSRAAPAEPDPPA